MERLRLYYREELLNALKTCSKSAAQAFETMLGLEVIPDMTSINLRPMDDLFMLPEDNIVVISDIIGELSGTMIASFKGDHGMRVINKIIGRDVNIIKDLEEEELGVLKEYINIIGGIFLTSFGDRFSVSLRPEVPNFEGKFSEIQSLMVSQLKSLNHRILFINASMEVEDLDADAVFYVLFDEDSLNMILNLLSKGDDNPFEDI